MIDKKYILGGISGIFESFFSHPFDFYKVKNQEAILKNKKIDPLLKYLYNNIKSKGFTSSICWNYTKTNEHISIKINFLGGSRYFNKLFK